MSIRFNKNEARVFLREQAQLATESTADTGWLNEVEELSRLCEQGVSKTHIAFFGTELLAKSLNPKVDLYAIKPKHTKDNPNSFSARSLAHTVLVPLSAELGINLGVTGREPLNNQPYFRMTSLDDGTPVHEGGLEAFDYMLRLVEKLSICSREEAQAALRSYLVIRRKYQPHYTDFDGKVLISPNGLIDRIIKFVGESSEGGKRAQAVAAGLLDVLAGAARVESGRINDPSRKYPGDICIKSASGGTFQKAFEVRDKPVSVMDVKIFGNRCISMGVREAGILMVNERQKLLDQKDLSTWAEKFGIGITLFHGWFGFVNQVLFWSELPKPRAAIVAVVRIYERLKGVEASTEAVSRWQQFTSKK